MPPASPTTPFIGNHYLRLPESFHRHHAPAPVRAPTRVLVNAALAAEIDAMPAWLDSEEGLATLAGNLPPAGGDAVALAYAGHQFGHWVPLLGDGRAVLLGQVRRNDGVILDLQLKGSGRTGFSRGGDGRATLGSALREYIVSEAMAGLGIPTTRSLAVCATGEPVFREMPEPGAVLARMARSHLRVGSFEFAASLDDADALLALTDHAIATLHPDIAEADDRALQLLQRTIAAQASLIARWMCVGFIHGVMNTDNMAISGETIDYGPCAFLDTFQADKVFSSIDRNGRYAWNRQASIGLWNLTRFAESLLPLLDADDTTARARATAALDAYAPAFQAHFLAGMRRKFGLHDDIADAADFINASLRTLAEQRIDFTVFFRRLTRIAAGDAGPKTVTGLFDDRDAGRAWLADWEARNGFGATSDPALVDARLTAMRAANPAVIARNHRVEEALRAARDDGDLAPTRYLCEALRAPQIDDSAHADLELPPQPEQEVLRTFCGT